MSQDNTAQKTVNLVENDNQGSVNATNAITHPVTTVAPTASHTTNPIATQSTTPIIKPTVTLPSIPTVTSPVNDVHQQTKNPVNVVAPVQNKTNQENNSSVGLNSQAASLKIGANNLPINTPVQQNAVATTSAQTQLSIANQTQSPTVNNHVNQNSNNLTAAEKQYIQFLINAHDAQIQQHLIQNDNAIVAANNNAQKALATANAVQANVNNRLVTDEAAIQAANSNANKALTDTSSTIAAINERLAKDEAAIAAANNTAAQTLAAVSNKPTTTNTIGVQGAQVAVPKVSTAPIVTTTTATTLIPNEQGNNVVATKKVQKQTANNAVIPCQTNNNQQPSTTTPNVTAENIPPKSQHHLTQLPGIYHRIMHADPASYTIQLIADSGLRSLYEYMSAYCLGYSSIPLHTKHLGKNWYVLIYGQFDNLYQANAALQQFPYPALKWKPFVRRMSDVQRMITDPRGEDVLLSSSHAR